MAKNEVPIFTRSPLIGHAEISIANPNRNGSGTIVPVVNGMTDGVRIDQIEFKADDVTTAGMVRLFISFNTGATWFLWREFAVQAITPSGTVLSWEDVCNMVAGSAADPDPPLSLMDSDTWLGAAPHNAEVFQVFARGGSFAA
jgi:hypothetical protein